MKKNLNQTLKSLVIVAGVAAILLVVYLAFRRPGPLKSPSLSLGPHPEPAEAAAPVKEEVGNEMEEGVDYDVWVEEPDTLSGVKGAVLHWFRTSDPYGPFKSFSSIGGRRFYFNLRHGFYVALPKEMGYAQRGAPMLGGHWNEFYNSDTTLVVTCDAMFYDVILLDYPDYEDTLRRNHLKTLRTIGKVKLLDYSPHAITAKITVDHSDEDNPGADYCLSKFVLKKDIEDRECEMNLRIWYADSLRYREKEFLSILNRFPDKPSTYNQ